MKYYRIVKENEGYNHDGLNVLDKPLDLDPDSQCTDGIYFVREEVLAFLKFGQYIREVQVPDDAVVIEENGTPRKWRANKVILLPRQNISTKVVQRLIAEGADIHSDNDDVINWAVRSQPIEMIRLLIEKGVDIHNRDDWSFTLACNRGDVDIVQCLINAGINPTSRHFVIACRCVNFKLAELLVSHGASVVDGFYKVPDIVSEAIMTNCSEDYLRDGYNYWNKFGPIFDLMCKHMVELEPAVQEIFFQAVKDDLIALVKILLDRFSIEQDVLDLSLMEILQSEWGSIHELDMVLVKAGAVVVE